MNLAKKFFFLFSLLSSASFLSGCQDVIFANIRKEVKLNDGTVAGSIRALIRFNDGTGEYIYLANGAAIYRKKNTGNVADHREGGWEKVCSARNIGNSDYVITLAADKSNLYALTATWEENTSKGQNRWNGRYIYTSKDGKNWNKVETENIKTDPTETGTRNPALYLFCTNTIKNDNRQAFFNYAGTGYKLSGTTASEHPDANGASSCSSSTVFAKPASTYYGSASCTNETNEKSATMHYYSNGRRLYYGATVSDSNKYVDAKDYIYSLAVTQNYILVGTASGIQHFRLDSTGNVGGAEDFDTNADAIMSSGYEVNALLVVDPSKNELDNAIYSAIDFEGRSQQFDHVCLWAYYPGRGNWNRD